MAEGRTLEAIETFRAVLYDQYQGWNNRWHIFYRLGNAFERAGQPDSAIIAYEQGVAYPGDYEFEYVTLAPSLERLVVLYDARGDTVQALENYRLLTELWKDADPELQPRVEAARQRIAELQSAVD